MTSLLAQRVGLFISVDSNWRNGFMNRPIGAIGLIFISVDSNWRNGFRNRPIGERRRSAAALAAAFSFCALNQTVNERTIPRIFCTLLVELIVLPTLLPCHLVDDSLSRAPAPARLSDWLIVERKE